MIDFIDSKLLNKKSNCGIINKKKKTYQSKTDSGWGWIIVISSFIIQLIIDGTFGGFGVLYLSLRNDQAFVNKNYSQTILSMPGTIQPGFFLCTGAFVSPLIQMFGFRISGCFGALLLGLGMSIASYLTNMHAIIIFYGMITGSAFGILMVCAIVSVNYYFDRYRGLASGLAMSGAGVGTLLVPVFYNWIIPIKGWRSSLLLYSLGASLLTALASLTLKPFITNDSSDDPELTKQSTVIEDSKQTTSDQMLVMKTIPEITYIDDDVIYLPGKNHNRTVDITAIHSDCKPDDSVFDFNGEKKERKLSIGFTDALRQYLLNQKGPTDLSETDNDAEDAESMIGSRLWKSSLGFKRQPSSYIHNQSQLCQPAQSNQQQKQNYNKFPNQTTQATVAATHGYIHSSYNLSSTRNSRRRKFPSQIYTLFDKPDAFYSASLTNLNPKITQPFNGYKKSTDSLRAYSKYPIKSKSSLISSETVNKNQINELIDSNISSSLNQQHQEQNHKEFHSLDNSIHKSSNNDIYLKSSIIETSIPEENLLTTNNTENSTEFYTLTSKMNTITQNLGLFGYGIIKLFDLGLFTEPSFLYLVGIGITSQLAYFIPFVYLIDYTVSYGMEQDSAVLVVMILSIFHTLGRITSGIMSNVFHLDSVYLSGLATFGGGLAHVFLVFIIPHTFAWYSIYASIYGLCSGIPIPLIPILLVRFSGLEHLTASFSNLNLLKGIFSMIGPTVAITIVEYTSQKDHLFLVAGVCYIVSALLHLGLCRYSCFAKYSKSSTNKQRTNDYDDTSNFEDPYAKCFPCSFQ
uniref:Putative monocarboxylate transporter n=1 Tax=Schistosoma mansoni TaxID=6183 RepID=A0A3Q0KPX2_SCHMA